MSASVSAPLASFIEHARHRVEAALSTCLPAPPSSPRLLDEAMRYSLLGGGKRFRPVLALAAADAVARGDEARVMQAAACGLRARVHPHVLADP